MVGSCIVTNTLQFNESDQQRRLVVLDGVGPDATGGKREGQTDGNGRDERPLGQEQGGHG